MIDWLLQGSSSLLAAAIAAWFALQTFYVQREHELVVERYLEGGLDLLSAELERIASTFSHNWARTLLILATYRDLGEKFDLSELDRGHLELNASNLNVVGHSKLYRLVRTGDYWTVYSSALADITHANSVIARDIPAAIRLKINTKTVRLDHQELAQKLFNEANDLNARCGRYLEFTAELQNLAAILETEKISLKTLSNFHKLPVVQESVERLRNKFSEEIRKSKVTSSASSEELR